MTLYHVHNYVATIKSVALVLVPASSSTAAAAPMTNRHKNSTEDSGRDSEKVFRWKVRHYSQRKRIGTWSIVRYKQNSL